MMHRTWSFHSSAFCTPLKNSFSRSTARSKWNRKVPLNCAKLDPSELCAHKHGGREA